MAAMQVCVWDIPVFPLAAAKGDLDTALEMSMGRGDAAMQAYSQRAMIKHMEGELAIILFLT